MVPFPRPFVGEAFDLEVKMYDPKGNVIESPVWKDIKCTTSQNGNKFRDCTNSPLDFYLRLEPKEMKEVVIVILQGPNARFEVVIFPSIRRRTYGGQI